MMYPRLSTITKWFQRVSTATLLLALTALLGCPEDPPAPTPECVKASDCPGLASDIGRLCKGGKCVSCSTAADCATDYGADAVCIGGLCTTCVDGETGCACLDDQYCIEGAGCQDGLCQPCTRGAAGCPCNSGACNDGLSCSEGVCVPAGCTAGSEGCTCGVDEACDQDLVCGEGTCHECPGTTEGCPCDQGACDIDLVCDTDSQRCRTATSCAELDCGAQRLCDDSGGQYHCLDECASGYRWNTTLQQCEAIPHANCQAGAEASILSECTTKHRTCVEETSSAHCGPCFSDVNNCYLGPAAETDGVCVAAITCSDCAAQHRDCTPATGCGDATCTTCITGYHESGGSCVAHTYTGCSDCSSCPACSDAHRACMSDSGGVFCADCLPHWTDVSGTCVAVPNCEDDADNSIAADCTAQHRECNEATLLTDAECGDCLSGYLEDTANGLCVSNEPCRSDAECPTASGYHCIQDTVTSAAYCRRNPCPDGEVLDRQASPPICKGCGRTCAESAALTGKPWPVTDRNGNCVCETKPGYFWDDAGGGSVEACDFDGDKWVNQRVYVIRKASLADLGAFQDDWTMVINARCDLVDIREFVLQNEWGQRLAISVSGTFGHLTGGLDSVTLYESTRNDQDARNDLPTYGARRLLPAEVNSLTKACLDAPADLNHNSQPDWNEDHGVTLGEEWAKVFNKLGYFTELYRGYIDGDRYIIVEHSRCDGAFALGYSDLDPRADDYWRSCTRRRDEGYNASQLVGYDYAEYECASPSSGPCVHDWDARWLPYTDPGTAEPPVGPASYAEIPAHGVCDNLAVANEPWRGMTHYSQFRCALARSTVSNARTEVDLDDLSYLDTAPATPTYVHLPYQLNRCGFADAAATALTCTQVVDQAVINSTTVQDHAGWVARRYQDYDNSSTFYGGGCINEWIEWRQMCPGFLDASDPEAAIRGAGRIEAFGALTCGCDYNYGGIACEIGCPGANPLSSGYSTTADPTYLFLSSDYQLGPRSGYWLCGAVQASEGTPLAEDPDAGTGYTLRGYVPAQVTATSPLCQNAVDGGCAEAGYAIRPSLLP